MTFAGARRVAIVLALVLGGGVWNAHAQGNIDFATLELQTVKVAEGLFVLMGGPAQGNIAVSIGPDGVFLVDSMYAQMHEKIVAAVKKLSPLPIRYVVNTHLHGDHTAGNPAMAKLGAIVISHDNMRKRMAEAQNSSSSRRAASTDVCRSPDAALQRGGNRDLPSGAGPHRRRLDHLLPPGERRPRR